MFPTSYFSLDTLPLPDNVTYDIIKLIKCSPQKCKLGRILVLTSSPSQPFQLNQNSFTNPKSFHISRHISQSLFASLERFLRKWWTRGRAAIHRLEALALVAVGKACYARQYSNSRLRKRELLIALGSHQEGSQYLLPLWKQKGRNDAILSSSQRVMKGYLVKLGILPSLQWLCEWPFLKENKQLIHLWLCMINTPTHWVIG